MHGTVPASGVGSKIKKGENLKGKKDKSVRWTEIFGPEMGKISMNLERNTVGESVYLMERCIFSLYSEVDLKLKVQNEATVFQPKDILFSSFILFRDHFPRHHYIRRSLILSFFSSFDF